MEVMDKNKVTVMTKKDKTKYTEIVDKLSG